MDSQRKDHGVEAPISLAGLFFDRGEDEEFDNCDDTQTMNIASECIVVRQHAWHQSNANKVWPGTFVLAEFLKNNIERYSSGTILELGSATGALAVFLLKNGFEVITRYAQ
jgi:hypothetical protein